MGDLAAGRERVATRLGVADWRTRERCLAVAGAYHASVRPAYHAGHRYFRRVTFCMMFFVSSVSRRARDPLRIPGRIGVS